MKSKYIEQSERIAEFYGQDAASGADGMIGAGWKSDERDMWEREVDDEGLADEIELLMKINEEEGGDGNEKSY